MRSPGFLSVKKSKRYLLLSSSLTGNVPCCFHTVAGMHIWKEICRLVHGHGEVFVLNSFISLSAGSFLLAMSAHLTLDVSRMEG